MLYRLLTIGMTTFLLTACGGNQPGVNLRLTPAERAQIDTLYRVQLDSLRPVWDSLCTTGRDGRLQQAVDSIVKERLEEEALLRERTAD
ncbi:MAG: hypothetical protein R2795_23055 [Saprospiraceae bacterium]